jgi:AcrR family transcriptional regulator
MPRPTTVPDVVPGPDGAAEGSEVRTRIITTARRSFLAHGFSRFTMDELARELAMSKKTLYAHFDTKDALVEAVLEAKIADFRGGIGAIVDAPALEPAERAHRLISHVVSQMSEVSPVFLRDLERLMPPLYARVESVRREVLPTVWGRLLEEGIARGDVRGDLKIPFVAEMVLLSVEGMLRPAVLERLELAPRDAVRGVLSTIFAGILTPAGRKAYEKNSVI